MTNKTVFASRLAWEIAVAVFFPSRMQINSLYMETGARLRMGSWWLTFRDGFWMDIFVCVSTRQMLSFVRGHGWRRHYVEIKGFVVSQWMVCSTCHAITLKCWLIEDRGSHLEPSFDFSVYHSEQTMWWYRVAFSAFSGICQQCWDNFFALKVGYSMKCNGEPRMLTIGYIH